MKKIDRLKIQRSLLAAAVINAVGIVVIACLLCWSDYDYEMLLRRGVIMFVLVFVLRTIIEAIDIYHQYLEKR